MAIMDITQTEAESLISMEKFRVDEIEYEYPSFGGMVRVPLISIDKREEFILDIRKSRIELVKGTYQNRARQVIILIRLDFGGHPHRNPDGEEIPSPHLHIYREGYGDKWAYPVPADKFSNLSDLWQTLLDFMDFCNIINKPRFRRDLFT
jgi:hypothetical protein